MRVAKGLIFLVVASCTNTPQAPLVTRPDTVHPQLDMTWGSFGGNAETVFNNIRSFAVGAGGDLYLYDAGQGVVKLNADGGFERVLASYGQGPNEVRSVPAMRFGAGLLAMWDIGNKRISIRDESGELLGMVRAPRYWSSYDESAVVISREGEVWVKLAPDASTDGQAYPRPEYTQVWPIEGDTIWVHAGGEECDRPFDYRFRNGFWADIRTPWFPSHVSALSAEKELYLGCNNSFSFLRFSGADSTRFERDNRELPVLQDERKFFESAWSPPMGTLPPRRPEYSRIIPSSDGTVWVYETLPPETWEASPEIASASGFSRPLRTGQTGGRFSVFDDDGTLIAVVPVPENVRYSGYATTSSVLVRGDTLWAVTVGSYEEEYISRFLVPISSHRRR